MANKKTGNQQLNARNNRKGNSDPVFNYTGKALWYPLNKKEYGEAKELYSDAEVYNQIDKLCDSGYGLSIKPTGDGNIKMSLLAYDGVNDGLMLTTITSSVLYGLRSLLYRHFQYYEGTWRTYESEEVD